MEWPVGMESGIARNPGGPGGALDVAVGSGGMGAGGREVRGGLEQTLVVESKCPQALW